MTTGNLTEHFQEFTQGEYIDVDVAWLNCHTVRHVNYKITISVYISTDHKHVLGLLTRSCDITSSCGVLVILLYS